MPYVLDLQLLRGTGGGAPERAPPLEDLLQSFSGIDQVALTQCGLLYRRSA